MKNKKIVLTVLGTFICIGSLLISFISFYQKNDLSILTKENTKAYKYATTNNIPVTILSDSEVEEYCNQDCNDYFEYNINNKNIEITKYKGLTSNIIIPEKIDDKKVTSINLNITNKKINSIYIPSSIEKIQIDYIKSGYSTLFYISIIFIIISYIIYLIVNIVLPNKTLKQEFNNTPINIVTIVHLVFQCIYSYIANTNNYLIKEYAIISSIVLLIYIFILIGLNISKKSIEKHDNKIGNIKEKFINKAIYIINDLIFEIKDKNTIDKLNELKEKIQYSDPVSNDTVNEIEKDIINLLNNLKDIDNKEEIINKLNHLISKRNKILKENK